MSQFVNYFKMYGIYLEWKVFKVISAIDKYVIEKIKEKRQEAGITQYDLAHQLVAPRTLISMVESGKYNRKYSLAQINEIAKILDCSIHDLLPKKPL